MHYWIIFSSVVLLVSSTSCKQHKGLAGQSVVRDVAYEKNITEDTSIDRPLKAMLSKINCAVAERLGKHLVLKEDFEEEDANSILVIPYVSNGRSLTGAAYSYINSRIILLNPSFIRSFTSRVALNDTGSFLPVLGLMLLHESGHFVLNTPGGFDSSGELSLSNVTPEYLTVLKKMELAADSLAIAFVHSSLKSKNALCQSLGFEIELIIPGIQFTLAGRRTIDNFGSKDIHFLHDSSSSHPNMELRITFMNYFLHPTVQLRELIDNYLYNRTVVPVHNQEFDPQIYQGEQKKIRE